jgi:hypothetical protein
LDGGLDAKINEGGKQANYPIHKAHFILRRGIVPIVGDNFGFLALGLL